MRKLLIAAVAAITLAGACGGGDDGDDVDAADGSTTTASTLGSGSTTTATAPPTGETTPADPNATTTTAGGGIAPTDTTPIDPATVETLPPPADPGPPPDPGFPVPDTGQYAYQTTGRAGGQPVNEATVTTVTAIAPNEVRYASADQVLDLQYRADGVYLRQLTARIGGFTISFQSAEGVLFIPVPTDAGRAWDWSLTDTTGGLTAAWHGTTQPAEPTANGGGPFPVVDGTITMNGQYNTGVFGVQPVAGTVAIRLWVDPAIRLPAQLHQVTNITSPIPVNIDTTSTFTGFTPG